MYQQVIDFWFKEIDTALWFQKSSEFDACIRERFSTLHQQASAAELAHWRVEPYGRLAEIIVLDQFSRNLFRDSAPAFASDTMALALAQEAIRCGADKGLEAVEKSILYMPFMHSESPVIHEQAVELYSQPGLEHNLAFELKHQAIIKRFGRYPHRNESLGRASTEEEVAFLREPGSSF